MKRLLFAALFATVAIGSSFAQQYRNTAEVEETTDFFDCEAPPVNPLCQSVHSQIYDNNTGALIPSGSGPYLLTYAP